MNPSLAELNSKLTELESATNMDELDIESYIRHIQNPENTEEACPEWNYEMMAFAFLENYPHEDSGWGTYFGPMQVWPTADGATIEKPSISAINQVVLDYWSARSKATSNPLLKARYADLVWDLSKSAIGKAPDVDSAISAAEALIYIADAKLYKHDFDTIAKLERALALASAVNKPALVERAKNAVLSLEDHIADDAVPGLCGFSFDLLVGNKKASLSEAQERKIIDDLESRLTRLQTGDPWACESTAERLTKYYRTRNSKKDVERIVRSLTNTFETAAATAGPVVAIHLLQHIHRICIQFGLRSESERLAKTMQAIGPQIRDDMKPISHGMEISQEKFERYVQQYVKGDLEGCFKRIISGYIPARETLERQLRHLANQGPFSYLFPKHITDNQGRVIAQIGPLSDDWDGHIVDLMAQKMDMSIPFLSAVLDRAIEAHQITHTRFIEHIFLSPIFLATQRDLISSGVLAYFEKQFHISIHLLIPQIEAAIRHLVELAGGGTFKPRRGGGFHLKTLDELLRSEEMNNAFGEDVALYLRVLFTDQRGWNIRNDVCHGVFISMSKEIADRLMHVLLLLSVMRGKYQTP